MSTKISRRSFLKHAALGAGGIVGGVILSACGGGTSQPSGAAQPGTTAGTGGATTAAPAASTGKRTITITTIPGAAGDHVKLAAENFMKANPDVEVKVNVAGGAETEYKPAFPQIVASSDKPDVAWYWVDGRQYQDIANAGLLEPLDDLYESEGWNKAIPESTLKVYTSPDGHKYAVCDSIVWYPQIYYSKEAFKKAGVEEPKEHYFTSLDAFYSACDKLRAAGYEPLTMGGKEGWIIGHTHDAILQRVATDEQLNDLLTNWRPGSTPKVNYTEPPWTRANELLLEFHQKKVFAEGYLGRSYAEGRALFVQGKAAMYQDGSWAASDSILYKEAPNLDFGWMIYPQVDPNMKPKFLLYGGNGMMIPKGGPNVDLAKKFLAFMISKEQMEATAKAKIEIPSRTDISPDVIKQAGAHVGEMYPMLSTIGTSTGWDDPVPADMAQKSFDEWQAILTGQMQPADAGAEMQKLAERHRSKQ